MFLRFKRSLKRWTLFASSLKILVTICWIYLGNFKKNSSKKASSIWASLHRTSLQWGLLQKGLLIKKAFFQKYWRCCFPKVQHHCIQCDCQSITKVSLKKHKRALHKETNIPSGNITIKQLQKEVWPRTKNVKYPCKHWDYQITAKVKLS